MQGQEQLSKAHSSRDGRTLEAHLSRSTKAWRGEGRQCSAALRLESGKKSVLEDVVGMVSSSLQHAKFRESNVTEVRLMAIDHE